MYLIKNTKTLAIITLLVLIFASPLSVFAEEGSRLRKCVDLPDEAQRSVCLAQLEAGANEQCAGKPDVQACKDEWKNGGGGGGNDKYADVDTRGADGKVVNGEKRQPISTCSDWDNCPLVSNYIVPAINALSGAMGIVVVSMIIWGGIRYTSSRDNPQQSAAAKEHIRNALFALVIYIFIMAFLNWIVPGGVFS